MARPRKSARPAAFTVTAGGTDGATKDSDEQPDSQTADVLAAKGDEGQKAPRARITRWNDNMREYATLDLVSAEVVDEAWVREEYGGGKYRVYYFGTMEDGTYGYLKKQGKEFIIDDSIPFRGAQAKRGVTGTVRNPDGSIAGQPQGSTLMDMGMLQLFKTMQDNSTLMMQQARDHSAAQTAMLERLATPRDSGMKELLVVLTPLLTPVIAGLLGRKDPMEIARELADTMRKNGGERSSVKDTIGAVKELLEVRELLGSGGGADDTGEGRWFGLLEKVVPGAMELIQAEAMKRVPPAPARRPVATIPSSPTPAPPALPVPSASTSASPSSAPVTTETTVTDEWTPLEPHVARLAFMAGQNKSPYGTMQTVMTLAPAPMIAAIRELVAKEDAVQILVTRFPVLAPYVAWTAQLVEEFRNELFGEDEPDDDGGESPEPNAPADPTPGDTHIEE